MNHALNNDAKFMRPSALLLFGSHNIIEHHSSNTSENIPDNAHGSSVMELKSSNKT